jgi:hypothetical protein
MGELGVVHKTWRILVWVGSACYNSIINPLMESSPALVQRGSAQG